MTISATIVCRILDTLDTAMYIISVKIVNSVVSTINSQKNIGTNKCEKLIN